MILALLLACGLLACGLLACGPGTSPDSGTPRSDGGGTTSDGGSTSPGTGWASPALTLPPEAPDLDPAVGAAAFSLRAAPAWHELAGPTGTLQVAGFAYEGSTPGPTLRVQVGDVVAVALDNQLGAETTIHWHGMAVPWAMDGATWMMDPVAAGEGFTYSFTASRAGTFWYHPHFDTERQVDLGLYGVVVVEDPAEPVADLDLVLVLDDWTEGLWDTGDAGGMSHDGEGLWTVNGQVQPTLSAPAGSRIRLRLLNASNAGYVDLRQEGLRVLALDQGRLPAARAPEGLVLAPGDRAELELLLGEEERVLWDAPHDRAGPGVGEATPLLTITPTGEGAAPAPLALPWSGEAATADPGGVDVVYVLSGDEGTGDWFINGEQWPLVTIQSLDLGQQAVIEVRNLSSTHHPFHLHGMAFEVLSRDGVAPEHRQVEDTIDLGLYGVARLRLHADNPGEWMAHCHILSHAHGGMMTVLRVGEGAGR